MLVEPRQTTITIAGIVGRTGGKSGGLFFYSRLKPFVAPLNPSLQDLVCVGCSGRRIQQGQLYDECGPDPKAAFYPDIAAMSFYYAVHYGQAQTSAFSDCLGGEEGLEDLSDHFLRNAGTIVAE